VDGDGVDVDFQGVFERQEGNGAGDGVRLRKGKKAL
jgi:hypothetical protein